MYHSNRRGGKSPVFKIIIIFIILVLIGLFAFIGNKFIFSSEDKKDISKSTEITNQETKEKDEAKPVEEEKPKEPEIDPTSHKKGTSHNHEAEAWSYSTKDVRQWITTPSTYTGEDKLVFLTFDDGPSEVYTNTVLDTLKSYGVHATFFIVGRSAVLPGAEEILKREMAEGHAVGLHSFSHDYKFLYPNRIANVENIISEIDQNLAPLKKVFGEDFETTVFRYPGGHMSWKQMAPADEALEKRNIQNIDWNALTGDAESPNSPRYAQSALKNLQDDMAMYGNPKVVVVLMHDIHAKSVDELPQIIEYYQGLGYKFGILS